MSWDQVVNPIRAIYQAGYVIIDGELVKSRDFHLSVDQRAVLKVLIDETIRRFMVNTDQADSMENAAEILRQGEMLQIDKDHRTMQTQSFTEVELAIDDAVAKVATFEATTCNAHGSSHIDEIRLTVKTTATSNVVVRSSGKEVVIKVTELCDGGIQ